MPWAFKVLRGKQPASQINPSLIINIPCGWRTKKSNHRELKSIREIMESEELGRIYKFLGSALSCSLIDLVFIHT